MRPRDAELLADCLNEQRSRFDDQLAPGSIDN
jgi:hypothetical protein